MVAVTAVGIRLGSDTALIPHVVVFRHEQGPFQRGPIDARDALLVVEVVSPSSKTMDRVAKPAKYAAAEIPSFWLLEIEDGDFSLSVFILDGQTYRLTERLTPGTPLRLFEPFPVTLDIAQLRLPAWDAGGDERGA